MSKAIVIKDADYSATKIKTVEFLEKVHCESVTLSESSLSLNTLDSQTLTATILPEDCTDVLTWESSDTDIVSVEDGVLTISGLGTATITATCGEQSASCAISVDNIEIIDFEFGSAENSNGNDNFATGNVPSSYKKVYRFYDKETGYASIPEPGNFILDDITKWRDVIKAPEVPDVDWEAMAKADFEKANIVNPLTASPIAA